MSDFNITSDGELMVVHIEGQTEAATEFVDAYATEEMVVVDSGRIILPERGFNRFVAFAKLEGLRV